MTWPFERIDEVLVVEDVALGGLEQIEDLVLDLLELPLVLRVLHDQLLALRLELRLLAGDGEAEHLVLQALRRRHEVEQVHLDAELGRVVRVPHLRGDEHAEALVVLDGAVAEAQRVDAALLDDLLEEHGLEHGVQDLADVLDEHGVAES